MPAEAVACPACRAPIRVAASPGTAVAACPACGGRFVSDAGGAERTDSSPAPEFPETASTAGPSPDDPTGGTLAAPSGPPPSAEFPFLAPPQKPDELGRLGPFRVLGLLGAGGMGAVFRTEDPSLRRQIALKVMLPQFASHPAAKVRFLREARSQAAVEHPHVIAIHQVGEEGGVPYIAMPMLKGQPLADALKANPTVPVAEAVRIARETAEGLAAAHEQNLIHRDVKPANVWLEGKNRLVKVLDFGLARAAADEAEAVTQEGAIIGTPAYMSPEQATGEALDARTDLFSLGVVLYQMLTGRQPFSGKNTPAILVSVTTHHPPRPAELNPQVPPDLDALTMRLLAKDPAHRPASAEAAADALRAVAAGLNQTLPVPVVYAPAAAVADPWEGIAGTEPDRPSSSVPAPRAHGAPAAEEPPASRPVRGRRRPLLWVASVLALVVTVAVAADVIVVIRNKDGSGTKIQVPNGAIVTIAKGGTTVAEFAPGGTDPAPDAGRAAHVLSLGGAVRVNGEIREIRAAADLPKGGYTLTGLNLSGGSAVADADLAHFNGCRGLTLLNLSGTPVTDAGLAHLKECKSLESLHLDGTKVTDAGLERLAALGNLTALDVPRTKVTAAGVAKLANALPKCRIEWDGGGVGPKLGAEVDRGAAAWVLSVGGRVGVNGEAKEIGTPADLPAGAFHLTAANLRFNQRVTDAGLVRLKDCKRLQHLSLDVTPVTDAGLAHLRGHTRLTNLGLGGTNVTDAGLVFFTGCKNLTELWLNGPGVTDAGLEHLGKHRGLTILMLETCAVTDAGLVHLRGCENLARLSLSGTRVTDASLDTLAGFLQLATLDVRKTRWTAEGVRKLAVALPGCKIEHDGGVFEPKM